MAPPLEAGPYAPISQYNSLVWHMIKQEGTGAKVALERSRAGEDWPYLVVNGNVIESLADARQFADGNTIAAAQ